MPPPSEALPATTSAAEDARDRRHWKMFWETVPGWLKHTVTALGTAATLYAGGLAVTKDKPEVAAPSRLEDRMLKQEIKMENVEKTLDKMDGKLDRLLGRRDR